MITEELLYFIWEYKLFSHQALATENKNQIEIIHPGIRNDDSGPDYFNARLKIGETTWAGNVEIHVKTNDWLSHQHQYDPAYQNVILHVVYNNDSVTPINHIPVLELKERIPRILLNNYSKIHKSLKTIHCSSSIDKVNPFHIENWLERIAIERIQQKTSRIKSTLHLTNGDWNQTFLITLFRNFGFSVNADPMETLGRKIDWRILLKEKSSLENIEAILFGVSGLLGSGSNDDYFLMLKEKYNHYKRKHGFEEMNLSAWKFSKMRPSNFPTIRIAQLSFILHYTSWLFSSVKETRKLSDFISVFESYTSKYWRTHYVFGKPTKEKEKRIGSKSIENIIINTVVPILFLYGEEHDDTSLKMFSIRLLSEVDSESNKYTREWEKHKLKNANALHSQAINQLMTSYCQPKKCLNCGIGSKIMKLHHDQ